MHSEPEPNRAPHLRPRLVAFRAAPSEKPDTEPEPDLISNAPLWRPCRLLLLVGVGTPLQVVNRAALRFASAAVSATRHKLHPADVTARVMTTATRV